MRCYMPSSSRAEAPGLEQEIDDAAHVREEGFVSGVSML